MTRLTAITVLMLGSLLPVERITRLRAEDGWLSLAGLLWLQEGETASVPPSIS